MQTRLYSSSESWKRRTVEVPADVGHFAAKSFVLVFGAEAVEHAVEDLVAAGMAVGDGFGRGHEEFEGRGVAAGDEGVPAGAQFSLGRDRPFRFGAVAAGDFGFLFAGHGAIPFTGK